MPSKSVDITPPTSYAALNAPDFNISSGQNPEFVPDEYDFLNNAAVAVDISFDGVNDHERLPATIGVRIQRRTKVTKVWVKGAMGSSIRVTARTDV